MACGLFTPNSSPVYTQSIYTVAPTESKCFHGGWKIAGHFIVYRRSMRNLILVLIASAVLFVQAASASTIYTINFSGGLPNPTSGSFTYDPVSGFSDFIVAWDSFTFDLTAGANAPGVFGTGCSGEAA